MSSLISIRNLYWRSSTRPCVEVLKDINLNLNRNDFLLLRGPAKSGKSMLLKLLGLFIQPSSGIIAFNNIKLKDLSTTEIKKIKRRTGFIGERSVFLNHMSLYSNIEYILKLQKTPESIIFERVMHVLKLTGLIAKRDMFPPSLSETEKKFFALSIALARKAEIFLCDFNIGGFEYEEEIIRILKNVAYKGCAVILSARKQEDLNIMGIKYLDIINGAIKTK